MTSDVQGGELGPVWVVTVELGEPDIGRVRLAVCNAAALSYGAYDMVAFETANGTQYFRSRNGSVMGEHDTVHEREVSRLTFSIPCEQKLLDAVISTILETHSYEEPVIYIHESLSVRSNDPTRSQSAARWWNQAPPTPVPVDHDPQSQTRRHT